MFRLRWLIRVALVTACTGSMAAAAAPEAPAATDEPLVETLSWGPVEVVISATPPIVALDRDILLTVAVTAPSEMEVRLPPLDDRLEGFTTGGSYEPEATTTGGRRRFERRVRLTPLVAETYRLAPFAVSTVDHSVNPPRADWFPTRPIVFASLPPLEGERPDDIHDAVDPVWIYPPFRTVALAVGAGLLLLALLALLWKLLTRVREQVALRRLSPRERALRELRLLLGKHLVEKGLVKDFYVELTMVVRRYIERKHRIRAPEQTTEEFLGSASRNPRFETAVLDRLKAFLQAADMVKFAAVNPDDRAIAEAIETARDYIEHDTAADDKETPAAESSE